MNTAALSDSTILVTGGAGFIGSAMSGSLVSTFKQVVAVDNLHPQIHETGERPASLHDGVKFLRGDVTEASTWNDLLTEVRPDIVVHLAAETGTGQSLEESTRHAMTNVVGTSQMLDGFTRHDAMPRRIVLSSSRAVYGEGAWKHPGSDAFFYPGQRTSATLDLGQWDFDGAEPTAMHAASVHPAPVSVYGATKLAQENIVSTWSKAHGIEASILRLQNVYGPGQSLINPYTGIMSLFCRMARSGTSIPLYEDGNVRRDFILIDDVASALFAAATSRSVSDLPIDIGSGEFQTIGTAARIIADQYGAPEPHVTGQYRQGDVRHAWSDVTAAREVLGWTPQYTLDEGISKLAAWIDEQPNVLPA